MGASLHHITMYTYHKIAQISIFLEMQSLIIVFVSLSNCSMEISVNLSCSNITITVVYLLAVI